LHKILPARSTSKGRPCWYFGLVCVPLYCINPGPACRLVRAIFRTSLATDRRGWVTADPPAELRSSWPQSVVGPIKQRSRPTTPARDERAGRAAPPLATALCSFRTIPDRLPAAAGSDDR